MKTTKKNVKRRPPIKYPDVWLVFSTAPRTYGQLMGMYDSLEEADADCYGPAFREARIVRYTRKPGVRATIAK